MDKIIARLNIAHFRAKLTAEQDEKTRQTLLRLLAEEETKLAAPRGQSDCGEAVRFRFCVGSK